MIVEYDKSFLKSIKKLKNAALNQKVSKVLNQLEKSEDVSHISNCKKLTGYKSYFRIKMGDYRIGFEQLGDDRVLMILVAHRKDIYKRFPLEVPYAGLPLGN